MPKIKKVKKVKAKMKSTVRVRKFSGKNITMIWDDGFGSFKADLKDGTECKISKDELLKALNRCRVSATKAKKYYHLEIID